MITIVLSTRHLVLGLFSAVVLFVALGGVGLVLARNLLPGLLARNEPAPQEQVLVVDSAAVQPQLNTRTPRPTATIEQTGAGDRFQDPAESTQPFGQSAEPVFAEPEPGQMFLQALSTTRPLAVRHGERMAQNGLPCIIASGANENTFRVLIGPIASKEDSSRYRARLEELGFQPILRQFEGDARP